MKKGDQILTTNHEYGALERTWNFISKKRGCEYVKIDIEVPYTEKQLFIDKFQKAINKKTKVIFLSHITSPTALIFPVKEIISLAKKAAKEPWEIKEKDDELKKLPVNINDDFGND